MIGRNLPKYYLKPGELMIAEEPVVISTVLGSCVSVVFYNARLRVGAICHATLPTGREEEPSKYVDRSIHFMLAHFCELGIQNREIVVKLFGGSDMFFLSQAEQAGQTVGAQNARMAVATLRQAGLEAVVSDIGGPQGRKLVFYSATGEVYRKWVKKEQVYP